MADREMTNEEAIEILGGIRAHYSLFNGYEELRYAALSKAISALRAEPIRHGQWEYIGGYGYQYRCSECVVCAERTSNYCPHCGAKMDRW